MNSILKNHFQFEKSIDEIIQYGLDIVSENSKARKNKQEKLILLESLLLRTCAYWENFFIAFFWNDWRWYDVIRNIDCVWLCFNYLCNHYRALSFPVRRKSRLAASWGYQGGKFLLSRPPLPIENWSWSITPPDRRDPGRFFPWVAIAGPRWAHIHREPSSRRWFHCIVFANCLF